LALVWVVNVVAGPDGETIGRRVARRNRRAGARRAVAGLGPTGTHPAVWWTTPRADASRMSGEIEHRQAAGCTVAAPPDPLRGIDTDAKTIAAFLRTISGAIVLAGHSYGGPVVTNAVTGNANVKALVYVDAYIPGQGESAGQLTAARPGSQLDPKTSFTFARQGRQPPVRQPVHGDDDQFVPIADASLKWVDIGPTGSRRSSQARPTASS
jgi:pimeloyl-ACP methyl ester carboxylesterase